MNSAHRNYILQNLHKKSVREIASDLNLKEKNVRKFIENENKNKGSERSATAQVSSESRVQGFKGSLLAILVILISATVIYLPSLKGDFLYDDLGLVRDNPIITQPFQFIKLFTQNIWAGAGISFISYRPVQIATYMIDYLIWGLKPAGFHLTSILVHALAAASIYWFVLTLFRKRMLAFLTALFFAVHPVHSEAVAYIASRADLLAGLFLFLSMVFYIKALEKSGIKIYALLVISYACALFSKEYSVYLPVLLLVYHFCFLRKIKIPVFSMIVSCLFIYLLIRTFALQGAQEHLTVHTVLMERIPGFFAALANYLRILLVPIDLHMQYGSRLFAWTEKPVALGILLMIALCALAFFVRHRNRLIFFSILWFFVALFPVSNLFPINAYMAEHWLYIPSLGFFLSLAYRIYKLSTLKHLKFLSFGLAASIAAGWSYFTFKQNDYWRDAVTFYERTLKFAPSSATMCNNLGSEYDNLGKMEEAVKYFKKSIEANPDYAAAHYNLAVVYYRTRQYKLAADHFSQAEKLKYHLINPELKNF